MPILFDSDTWDDTALIDAYERATESYNASQAEKKDQVKTRRDPLAKNSSQAQKVKKKNRGKNQNQKVSVSPLQQPNVLPHVPEQKSGQKDVEVEEEEVMPQQSPNSKKRSQNDRNPADNRPEKKPCVPNQHSTVSHPVLIPPPPPALYEEHENLEIEKLLLSWYEAGYRAGMYAATHKK